MSIKSKAMTLYSKAKYGVIVAPIITDALSAMSLAGCATSKSSRVMLGAGLTATFVGAVLLPGLAAKIIVSAGVAAITAGMIQGFKVGMKDAIKIEDL